MTNRLADAISPYLRAHADNPVDWYPWGEAAFAEARRRDVPLFISIGYSTCHWCHVMARESFSDPALASELNARFVAIKVDREEHPDVDAGYLAAASAFTPNLGWPLSVFATPEGRTFFAGTYFPPDSRGGQSSFRQVLAAVSEAWDQRRDQVQETAGLVTNALAATAPNPAESLPGEEAIDAAIATLIEHEDALYGGFGGAPKFPVAPALGFLLQRSAGAPAALRTLEKMAASPLRDTVDGGFFRYATQRNWSVPHYERMLYDNSQLLRLYADAAIVAPSDAEAFTAIADGVAGFLTTGMRLQAGAFASAQDSESTVDGKRVEGEYYALDADARSRQTPPARDEKVLTGWNGLAIGALAHAGFVLDRPQWIQAACEAADALLIRHVNPDGTLARASIGERVSSASATLEDYGMFAGGLIEVALATGRVEYANRARAFIDATMSAAGPDAPLPFTVPGGADPVLVARGLATRVDPSEGAYPSGLSAVATAAHTLFLLTGQQRYADAARAAMRLVADAALESPVSFGAALQLMSALTAASTQLVLVTPDEAQTDDGSRTMVDAARSATAAGVSAVVTQQQAAAWATAGFELFEGRGAVAGAATAYYCLDFVCKLPTTDPHELARLLG
jgi:uncharacterized protein